MTLGEKLKARRMELGWSQEKTAEEAGVTQPLVSRYERDKGDPMMGPLTRLVKALGGRLDVCFG